MLKEMDMKHYLKLYDTVKIPSWALCYIFNGDAGNLTDEEQDMIDNFLDRYPGATYDIKEENLDSPYFTMSPAFGLACDVYDMDIYLPNTSAEFMQN